jgi:hypothetical protein
MTAPKLLRIPQHLLHLCVLYWSSALGFLFGYIRCAP